MPDIAMAFMRTGAALGELDTVSFSWTKEITQSILSHERHTHAQTPMLASTQEAERYTNTHGTVSVPVISHDVWSGLE